MTVWVSRDLSLKTFPSKKRGREREREREPECAATSSDSLLAICIQKRPCFDTLQPPDRLDRILQSAVVPQPPARRIRKACSQLGPNRSYNNNNNNTTVPCVSGPTVNASARSSRATRAVAHSQTHTEIGAPTHTYTHREKDNVRGN